jgi:hypothetical protein
LLFSFGTCAALYGKGDGQYHTIRTRDDTAERVAALAAKMMPAVAALSSTPVPTVPSASSPIAPSSR